MQLPWPAIRRAGQSRRGAGDAAGDATLVDRGHRVAAQGVRVRLGGERGTAREADAGMIAGADRVVDAVARLDHPLAARELAGILGLDAALAGELALAVGDDD